MTSGSSVSTNLAAALIDCSLKAAELVVNPEGFDSLSVGPADGPVCFSELSRKSKAVPSYEAGWESGTAMTSSDL